MDPSFNKHFLFFSKTLFRRILFAGIILIISMKLMSFFALSSFHKVIVTMQSETGDDVKLYYSGSKRITNFSEKYSSDTRSIDQGVKSNIKFKLRNETIGNLRIDTGSSPGQYSISQVKMYSFFGPSLILTPETPKIKYRLDPKSIIKDSSGGWTFTSEGEDPYIILLGDFKVNNLFLAYFFPLLLAFFAFQLLPEPKFRARLGQLKNVGPWLSRQSFFVDVVGKRSSSGSKLETLDGLRGMAAILVLADHAEIPGSAGLGPIGVIIFFCLSGFLLTMPFAQNPGLAANKKYVKEYFFRRLRRIVPMFYFIIIIQYLLQGHFGDFIRTALFIQGLGILWTVVQEVYFYILLPFIIIVNFYVLKGRPLFCALFLLVLTYLFTNQHIGTFQVYLYESKMPLFIGIFLSGMAMCFIYHIDFIRKNKIIQRITDNHAISLILLFLLVLTHYVKRFYLGVDNLNPGWVYVGNYCFFIALFLMFVVLSKNSILAKILTAFPIRAVGIVGYSFYLLHPFVLHQVLIPFSRFLGFQIQLSPVLLFILALILTYILSAVTYTFIEKPFLKK